MDGSARGRGKHAHAKPWAWHPAAASGGVYPRRGTFMMHGPTFALHITWTCYGTWLPGDERGHVSDVIFPDGGFVPASAKLNSARLRADPNGGGPREAATDTNTVMPRSTRRSTMSPDRSTCSQRSWTFTCGRSRKGSALAR